MNTIIFWSDWLLLEKKEFRIMVLLAINKGKYIGNLSEMCRILQLDIQSKNRNALRLSMEALEAQGFLSDIKHGNTFQVSAIPRGEKIEVSAGGTQAILKHAYSSEAVAWEQVLRVYLWICQNQVPIITNDDIANDLKISSSTVIAAKNVLEKDFGAIMREVIKVKQDDDTYKCIGQHLTPNAWFNLE